MGTDAGVTRLVPEWPPARLASPPARRSDQPGRHTPKPASDQLGGLLVAPAAELFAGLKRDTLQANPNVRRRRLYIDGTASVNVNATGGAIRKNAKEKVSG